MAALVAVAVLLGAGCGGSDVTITSAASRQLQQDVLAVTEAVAAADAGAAAAGLIRLHGHVLDFQTTGALSATKAAQIEAAAGQVAADLAALRPPEDTSAPPAPRTSSPSSTSTAPKVSTEPKDKGKGKGHGHG